jgi:ABC-type phosphate transport system permease subunit
MDIVATTQQRSTSLLGASPGVRARKLADQIATVVLWIMASSIILLLALFIIYMFYLGVQYLTPSFIFGLPAETTAGGGIGPEIYNSFYILILTLVFTVPISTAAGVYLHEYAKPGRFRELVVFSAESLATIPSIVMGLFGLLVFVYLFKWKFTALGGERPRHVSRSVDGDGRHALADRAQRRAAQCHRSYDHGHRAHRGPYLR